MSFRAKFKLGSHNPQRWMAEINYRDGRPPAVLVFEELEQLDEIVEHGPDWREIENIVITLNCWAPYEELKGALRRRGEPGHDL
jgi:hypothetical protein